MSEDWEYTDEAIQAQSDRDYLDSCPAICHNCRWLDSYYRFGCTQQVYPVNGKCYMHTDHKWFKRLWLGKKLDLHYLLWQAKVWFCEKVLRMRRNVVGSWRQWE